MSAVRIDRNIVFSGYCDIKDTESFFPTIHTFVCKQGTADQLQSIQSINNNNEQRYTWIIISDF